MTTRRKFMSFIGLGGVAASSGALQNGRLSDGLGGWSGGANLGAPSLGLMVPAGGNTADYISRRITGVKADLIALREGHDESLVNTRRNMMRMDADLWSYQSFAEHRRIALQAERVVARETHQRRSWLEKTLTKLMAGEVDY